MRYLGRYSNPDIIEELLEDDKINKQNITEIINCLEIIYRENGAMSKNKYDSLLRRLNDKNKYFKLK